ncbi:YpuI family protein [Metabacillus sp. GX 13764]|uniref:YpuI family protein n=1 Tax=Metabacillus kandeliae TaxID=2900151 RepID=UPI001E5CD262|nr:YpuI family protein [Metabacillus kandeliae]MCD7033313.1 YpuI family protein [Metabacillus kandeliae]
MGNSMVKAQTEQTADFLKKAVGQLTDFLNEATITNLMEELQGEDVFYKELLGNFRRLTVFCEEGLEACQVIIYNDPFRKGAAEKVLYRIYHQCIEEFFQPKQDVWYEDSRSAYTGKNSIKFRQDVPHSIKQLVKNLESDFQNMREELEYYETDYRTKMMQSR